MKKHPIGRRCLGPGNQFSLFLFLCGGGMLWEAFAQTESQSELRGSLAGERAIQELKRSITNEPYNLRYGPVRFQTEARLGAAYTDHVFLSALDQRDDFVLNS